MAGMCDTCHAGCCRAYNLLITAYDAIVLSRDLELPMAEFVTLLAVPVGDSGELEKVHGVVRFSDPGLENNRFLLALKRVDSALIPGTMKCHFLQEWQRQYPVPARGDHPGSRIVARCGVYGSRPLMCRTFPTAMHPDGALGYVDTPSPVDLATSHEIYKGCPEKWSAQGFSEDPAKAIHTLVLSDYEKEFQRRAFAEWNQNPGPMRNFFPFMLAAYAGRFRLAAELSVGTPQIVPQAATFTGQA